MGGMDVIQPITYRERAVADRDTPAVLCVAPSTGPRATRPVAPS
jgi:hypothetical protein